MLREDTITAISTPLGRGGIGIVRLSGSDAIKIADAVFRSPKEKKITDTPSHCILYGHIIDPSIPEIIDEVLVSVMKAPNTYTKEDIIEINCHGGTIPLRRILELLLEKGARLAEPGEFTRRAFLNGRIDLAQAEAVLDVVNALTVESQKTALQQLTGSFSAKLEAIGQELIDLTALVEAHIDFPDEDMEPLSLEDMKMRAASIRNPLKKLIDSSRYGMILRDGLKAAIIGRPNVGKSSLLNALLEHDRAIVTEIPGTTRDVIEEYLNIQGLPVRIMDTAGIRDVREVAEKEGVRRSLRLIKDADLILLVLDGSEPLHETDRELMNTSRSGNTILVINKGDLPQKIDPAITMETMVSPAAAIRISAKHGAGLDMLKERILMSATGGPAEGEVVTNTRHVHALKKGLSAVESFLTALSGRTSPEYLAVDLREALDALGEILGTTTPDDILERIFKSFCIGK